MDPAGSSGTGSSGQTGLAPPPIPERPLGPMDSVGIDRILGPWLVAGALAALIAGILVMIASATYARSGFFTPLYRLSALYDPAEMDASMAQARGGHAFYVSPEATILGLAMLIAPGGVLGMVFGLLARALRLRGRVAIVFGAGYGAAVLLAASLMLMPVAGADLADRVGWPGTVVAFLAFGLLLGGWAVLRPQDVFVRPRRLKR